MRFDVVARLREATGAAHERLEARLDILGQIASPERRRALVERFYGLHEGADRGMGGILRSVARLDYADRCRRKAIERDLSALGRNDLRSLPVCAVAAPGSSAEALGFFYVLEGSTLGGKAIRRELASCGQDMTGLAFLDPYGSASGQMWRAFLAVLRGESPSDEGGAADQMVTGAMSGFRHAEAWLCG